TNIKALGVQYMANKKAWCTTAIMIEFLSQFDCLMANQQKSAVLLMDNFSAHLAACINMKALRLPSEMNRVTIYKISCHTKLRYFRRIQLVTERSCFLSLFPVQLQLA